MKNTSKYQRQFFPVSSPAMKWATKTHIEKENMVTDTSVTLPEIETLPEELVISTESYEDTDNITDSDKDEKNPINKKPIILAVVLGSVGVCVVVIIMTVASSKTNVRSRRQKKLNKKR